MRITKIEQHIPSWIFQRGEDYFQNNKVSDLKQLNPYEFTATVMGSEHYDVQIRLNAKLDINLSYCDCPHAFDNFCKHQVAVCLAIRSSQELTLEAPIKPSNKINSFYLDELDEDELKHSKLIVQSAINSSKSRGFITYHQSFNALKGAEEVNNIIEDYIETGRYQMAVATGLQTLLPIVKALIHADDSSGDFGEMIHQLLTKIHYAVFSGEITWTKELKKSTLTRLLKASSNKVYDDWPEYRYKLIQSGISLCEDPRNFNMIWTHTQKLESAIPNYDRYEYEQLKILQYEFLLTQQNEIEIQSFLEKNRKLDVIKDILIERAIVNDNLEDAMNIALDGEKDHGNYPGLKVKWRTHQYELHKLKNHIPQQKVFSFELVSGGNIDYFNDLKSLYSQAEWPEILEELLFNLKNNGRHSILIQLLKQENLIKELLDFCSTHLHHISNEAKWILPIFPNETEHLYTQWIYEKALQSTNRSAYRGVCREIKSFQKTFGNVATNSIIQSLNEKYPFRTALHDELSKIKH